MGADIARLSVQGARKHVCRINLLLTLCRRWAEFAELPRVRARATLNVFSRNSCSVPPLRVSTSLLL